MELHSRNPTETRALARDLAREIGSSGLVIALVGPLGAGKTVFAKGLAEGLDVDEGLLSSPSFVIANELSTPRGVRLVHADLYRVESEGELESAGWLDWLEEGSVVAIEWGDRFPQALPRDHLEVRLSGAEADRPERRTLDVRAGGPVSQAALERWRKRRPRSCRT
jgi:tRNA threonylcarbamoyladenosine biosynthesis protein TsaE